MELLQEDQLVDPALLEDADVIDESPRRADPRRGLEGRSQGAFCDMGLFRLPLVEETLPQAGAAGDRIFSHQLSHRIAEEFEVELAAPDEGESPVNMSSNETSP